MMYLIGLIILIIIVVSTNKVPVKFYWIGVLTISAILVYSTTLLGSSVVGSDIQGELRAARNAMAGVPLFGDIENQNATSLVTVMLAPALGRFIDIVWVFKVILPIFLIFVPVVLYFAYKGQFGEQNAFYSAVFFSIMPTFSLEIATIVKSMVAELFFAVMILAVVGKMKWKLPIIIICVLGMIVSHYTIALAALAYLTGILGIRIVLYKWWKNAETPLTTLGIPLVIGVMVFAYYYSLYSSVDINSVVVNIFSQAWSSPASTVVTTHKVDSLVNNYPAIVKVALGMDFFDATLWGKMFRIVQIVTQASIVIGAALIIFKSTFSAEFKAGIICSLILVGLCVVAPGFSNILNMTRFYHIALFFLAPCLVMVWRPK
jgi:uncharacterized membrane protein